MSYIMRDRPDGQVEIILSRPVLVGVFPARDVAEKIHAFLSEDEREFPDDQPILSDDQLLISEDPMPGDHPDAPAAKARMQLPALIVELPRAPAQQQVEANSLSEEDVQRAFGRIQQGEKIHAVASDFGLTMGQLRGMWANHKRYMQKFMADAGQQACTHCQRPFIPSLSHPDTCARCSK